MAFSEKFMKPLHGKKVFGHMMLSRLEWLRGAHPETDGFLITDSGFREEAEVLVEEYGPECMTVIRLHRHGFTFAGDSRNLVDLVDLKVRTVDINSPDGDLPGLFKAIKKTVPYLFRS